MKIGVITGMKEELTPLQRPFSILPQDVPFYCFQAKVDPHLLIGATAGCGKVAAAMCATMLIEKYHCQILVVSGVAGLLNSNGLADVYAVTQAIQHDYGQRHSLTDLEIYRPGQIPLGDNPLDPEYAADPHLVESLMNLGNTAGLCCELAKIATGDVFATGRQVAAKINGDTLCNLVDMETAAVAQVAFAYDIPWVGIKSVSDNVDGTEFEVNLQRAIRRSTVLTERLIESL